MENNKTLIPGAIIVAGLLIAGAVYYNGSGGNLGNGDTHESPDGGIVLSEVTENDHILGNPDADIFIVEYSDIDCPFCQRFHNTMHEVIDNYPDGEVAWVYRHFPLTQLHPQAALKAEATECVAELGGNDAFWNYLDILFERDEDASALRDIAVEVGVDSEAFDECVESGRHQEAVRDNFNDAQRAGGTGTPYSVIVSDGTAIAPINGAQEFANITQVIDTLLSN